MRAASTDEENFLMIQEAYKACINETAIQKKGIAPLVSLVNEIAASFPVNQLGQTLQEGDYAALSDTILLLERLGVPSFMGIGVGADDKNPDVVIVQAYPAGLTLPTVESYQDNDTISLYQSMLEQVLATFLPTLKVSAKELARSVIEFEKKIAAITPPVEEQADVTVSRNC